MKIYSPKLMAGLILQIEYLFLVGLITFTDGYIYVRLVNPSSSVSNPPAGRLEVRLDYGAWGTVCDDEFTAAAAQVVCSSLGFGRAGSVIANSYGQGSGEIWLDDVVCSGYESNIGRCSHRGWGVHNCGHSEDVAIDCDECYSGQSQCSSSTTTCVNTIGSYYCSCKTGYRSWISTSCTDIDECSTGQYQCNTATPICVNTVGSYRCSCRDGYTNSMSMRCTDINECTTGQSHCDASTTICHNTVGSYYCSCKNGYEYSTLSSCNDVDECERGEQLCDNSTTICINSDGSYTCACRTGYKRENDTTCSDIDECISVKSECDLMSTDCINTIGNYTCRCRNGFTYLNETTCLEKRIGVIVGSSVGAFLVVASIAILLLIFYRERRKEVNQPQQTESSSVNNGPEAENSRNSNIYMPLEATACGKTRQRMNYTPMDKCTILSAPSKTPKETVQFASYENVQPSTNAKGLCSIDEGIQPVNYENVELANYENVELASDKNV